MKLRRVAGPAGIGAMRFLGIDYGARRIGLSYGDELGVAAGHAPAREMVLVDDGELAPRRKVAQEGHDAE